MLPTLHVFGLTLPMFGIMMMCGMISAFVLMLYTHKFSIFNEDDILSCALWAIILGMLGAKILYWIVELDDIIANPAYLLQTLTSGFVFYGALIGGVLGVVIHCARKKQPLFAYCDLFAPSFAIAQAFGRIGCFCAGCCYGSPSECALAVTYPAGIGSAAPSGVPLLPTQLMESAFLVLLTVALVLILRKKKTYGTVFGWYLVSYGVWRFIIEFFRSDDRGAVGGLSTSQFIGIFVVLAGIAVLILAAKNVLKGRADDTSDKEEATESTDENVSRETISADHNDSDTNLSRETKQDEENQ